MLILPFGQGHISRKLPPRLANLYQRHHHTPFVLNKTTTFVFQTTQRSFSKMRLSSFVMWALASTASAIAIGEPSPVVVDREVSSPGASELYNELKNLAVRDIEDTFKREASTDLA